MVLALFVTDTAHSLIAVYAAWELCVTNFDNPASLGFVSWTIPFTAIATSVAAILTQAFLGHRVLKMTKNYYLTGIIGVLSVLAFIFGVYAGVRSGIIREVQYFAPLVPYVICWLGFQTAADLMITLVLSFVLSRSRTGFRKTDTIINRLIRGAIQTGLFASIFALSDLFSFVFHRNTNLYAMFAYPIGRIYTNTLLDTLNSRIELKLMNASMGDSGEMNTYHLQNQTQTAVQSVHIKREVMTHVSNPDSKGVDPVDAKYPADHLYGSAA